MRFIAYDVRSLWPEVAPKASLDRCDLDGLLWLGSGACLHLADLPRKRALKAREGLIDQLGSMSEEDDLSAIFSDSLRDHLTHYRLAGVVDNESVGNEVVRGLQAKIVCLYDATRSDPVYAPGHGPARYVSDRVRDVLQPMRLVRHNG
jgi:hypothetical protein